MKDTTTELKRSDVDAMVKDARARKKNKKNHVRKELEKNYPELVSKTIRRNGRTYLAIDYLMEDIDSYE